MFVERINKQMNEQATSRSTQLTPEYFWLHQLNGSVFLTLSFKSF